MQLRDLNVQIESLLRVLDQLDAQIRVNIQEIVDIRIPQAAKLVYNKRLRNNNVLVTGALASAGGQILKTWASNWNLEKVTYQTLLSNAATLTAGVAFSHTQLLFLEKDKKCPNFYNLFAHDLFKPWKMFGFLTKISSPYFVQDPKKFLNEHNLPKVLKLKLKFVILQIKDELSCQIADGILSRAIDYLSSVLLRRLEVSERIIGLIMKRNELSEPLQFMWFRP